MLQSMRLQGVRHDFAIEQEEKHITTDLMKLINYNFIINYSGKQKLKGHLNVIIHGFLSLLASEDGGRT